MRLKFCSFSIECKVQCSSPINRLRCLLKRTFNAHGWFLGAILMENCRPKNLVKEESPVFQMKALIFTCFNLGSEEPCITLSTRCTLLKSAKLLSEMDKDDI